MERIANKWVAKEPRPKKEEPKEAPQDKPLYNPVCKASRIRTLNGVRK